MKTGMRLKEAYEKCPALIQCPAHPERYTKVSSLILESLYSITPEFEKTVHDLCHDFFQDVNQ